MRNATETRNRSPKTALVAGGGVIALVLVATLVITALRGPAEYPAGSPEAAMQAYAQAIIDGDEDAAAALLSPELACDAGDLAEAQVGDDVRVTLRETDVDGDTAAVQITVTVVGGQGPFDTYEYDDRHRFELERSGDGWLITRRPWPYASCWR